MLPNMPPKGAMSAKDSRRALSRPCSATRVWKLSMPASTGTPAGGRSPVVT